MKRIAVTVFASLLCLPLCGQTRDVYSAWREAWAAKAEASKPQLAETVCRPQCLVEAVADPEAFQGWRMEKCGEVEDLYSRSMKEVKEATVDFGRHMTGYFTFTLKTTCRVQDAPVRLRFTFAEVPAEAAAEFDPYTGTLSRAWLQDETVTLMDIDRPVTLDRRLAGRYVKIELLGASPDFDFVLSDMYFTAVSSAEGEPAPISDDVSADIKAIYDVATATLAECMQTVYEDGPKRDARLWIGDLYLESIANACTFRRHDLTRRCLYLLASLAADDGRLHANVFERPAPHPQYGSYCLSYSLLFNVTLAEYLASTGDEQTARDLWVVARNQMQDALSYLDERHIFDRNRKGEFVWLFFDWRDGFEESTAMQGLTVFALERTYELARRLGVEHEAADYPAIARKMKAAARKHLWDKQRGVFVSGADRQVSYLSQVWAVISGIVSPSEGAAVLERIEKMPDAIRPGSPYGNHYLVEAMIRCGMYDRAREFVLSYWGGMTAKGADTFWEVYDPQDEYLSPYGFYPVNSYCHAWSCTPAYFIHRYPEIFR